MIMAVKKTSALVVVCILLAASLIVGVANYTTVITAKDNALTDQEITINNLTAQIEEYNSTITSLENQMDDATSQIEILTEQKDQLQTWLYNNVTALTNNITTLHAIILDLESQISTANSQLDASNSRIAELQSQVNYLRSVFDMSSSRLQTLVFYVSEKGPQYTWGHLPNATYTYNEILNLNKNKYTILLLPEYKGHENWTEELSWIANNFGGKNGIPIMLNVFGGGDTNNPTPMLSLDDIREAMSEANIKQIRISEVISWHMDHPETPFPTAYLTDLFEYARANNLKVFWTEWKIDYLPEHATFISIQNYIKGFEDIVTVSFSTNSEDLEPSEAFLILNEMFEHWGGSVQAWYWQTRYNVDLLNMPISTLVQHALLAKNIGAETIQFEPYWYFFENGEPNDYLRFLMGMLT